MLHSKNFITAFIFCHFFTLLPAAPQPDTLWMNLTGERIGLLYFCNGTIEHSDSAFTRAVVVVHGADRNADGYYDRTYEAAQMAGQAQQHTIIVAPFFMIPEDNPPPGVIYWDYNSQWKQGDASSVQLARRKSSFAVMDSIIRRLLQNQPNLQHIVIAGHSAGGQFVNRYAAGNRIQQMADSVYQVDMRYLIANPSSYVYLNNKRRVQGTMNQFAVPQNSGCQSTYDNYRYGLKNLNSYMWYSSADSIRAWYRKRRVYYLLGEEDNDPNHSSLDTSCPAELQGAHRLERGLIYYNYIGKYYGQEVYGNHFLATIPGIGHSSSGIFQSFCGRYVLFGWGHCDPLSIREKPHLPEQTLLLKAWPNPFNARLRIEFNLPERSRIRLSVYDPGGKLLTDLVKDQQFSAGEHRLFWSAGRIASGIYFVRLNLENGKQQSSKIILLK